MVACLHCLYCRGHGGQLPPAAGHLTGGAAAKTAQGGVAAAPAMSPLPLHPLPARQPLPAATGRLCRAKPPAASFSSLRCIQPALQIKAGLDAYCAANRGEFDTHGTEATYRCVLARLRRAVWSPLLAAPHRLKLALLCATARTCQRFFGICNTYMCQHTFAGHTFPGGTPGPCRDITSPQGVLLKVEWHYRLGAGPVGPAVPHSMAW